MSTPAENKDVVRRLYAEVMGESNWDAAGELFTDDYVDHMPIMETPDVAGLLTSVEAARLAFPDAEAAFTHEIAEEDLVAVSVAVDGGRHLGPYMGVPPTGRPVSWTETHVFRLADGRIAEHWGNVSMLETHAMIRSHDIDTTLA